MTTHPSNLQTPIIPDLSAYGRTALEDLVTIAIAIMDQMDGDTDFEEDDAEDSFVFSHLAQRYRETAGPGCPIGDPGGGNVEDDGQAEEERDLHLSFGIDQSEAEPIEWANDRALRAPHLRRVRETRCRKTIFRNPWGGQERIEYRLR